MKYPFGILDLSLLFVGLFLQTCRAKQCQGYISEVQTNFYTWIQTGYYRVSKEKANSFLTPMPSPLECCGEAYCESEVGANQCHTPAWKNYIVQNCPKSCGPGRIATAYFLGGGCHYYCTCDVCNSNPCKNGGTCTDHSNGFSCQCVMGYTGVQCETETDECASNPCKNGGTCTDKFNSFSCACVKGYTGLLCETDINECVSSPCQNGAICHDGVNMFKCECVGRFYGILCDTNICHPTPADVVFLLDSSISMTESQFKKQLDFIANFSDHVVVGPRDFQLSVVTFSFKAQIEFYLNNHTDNSTLKAAVSNIKFRPGGTYTDKALEKLPEIFKKENGGERHINNTLPDRFVFVMTDGMSTNRKSTKKVAKEMRNKYGYGFQMVAIGIGNEVSHQELLDIASKPTLVYSVQDYDSLYTVLKHLVHYTCDECFHSSITDVAIFIDTSSTMNEADFHVCQSALSEMIELIDLHINTTHISITNFGSSIQPVFGFNEHFNKDDIQMIINTQIGPLDQSPDNIVNATELLYYIESHAFQGARPGSKRLVVIVTNGRFKINTDVEFEIIKGQLLNRNITTVCVGSGSNTDMDTLLKLANDEFDLYVEAGTDFQYLQVLKSYVTYNVCELSGG